MDKENANIISRRTHKAGLSPVRTPPRFRKICNKTISANANESESESGASNVNAVEEFSFQKLRGAAQQFEKKQKDHYTKCKKDSDQNVMHHSYRSTVPVQHQHTTSSTTSSTMTTPRKTQPAHFLDKPKSTVSASASVRASASAPAPAPMKVEDFSFQALKQKALIREGKKPAKMDSEEDFSFQNLKAKAKSTESASSNNNSNGTTVPRTPVRIPAKRAMPMTPMTPQTVGSRSKSRCRTPMSPHRSIIAQPMPMNMNMPSQYSSLSSSTPTRSRIPPTTPQKKEMEVGGLPKPYTNKTASVTTTFNPSRFKFVPKIHRQEVQATDDRNASVQKISQWLSDDPFDKKKQVVIRKGEQIANKSRAFEHDELLHSMANKKESRVQREKQHFPEGKVSQGKSWLQKAFGEGEEEVEEVSSVIEKQRMIQNAFKRKPGVRY